MATGESLFKGIDFILATHVHPDHFDLTSVGACLKNDSTITFIASKQACEFLELARAEAGLPGASRHPMDLVELTRGLVDAFDADERYAAVTFALDVQAGLSRAIVAGVPRHLETALRNLFDNAASFAPAGHDGPARVAVRLAVAGDIVHLGITDTGSGIPEEHLPR